MEAKYLLFLEDNLEPIISTYLSEHFQMRDPVNLEQFFFSRDDMKVPDEGVIIITQKRLANELAEIGPLHESIQDLKKAGVIIVPDEPFVSISNTAGEKQIAIINKDVAGQFKKSVDIILDGSMPRHTILFI